MSSSGLAGTDDGVRVRHLPARLRDLALGTAHDRKLPRRRRVAGVERAERPRTPRGARDARRGASRSTPTAAAQEAQVSPQIRARHPA